jgi:hypothetical protein
MLMRKFAATSALLIAAMGVTAGTVNAAPATEAANDAVRYSAVSNDTQSVITTDSGSMVVEDGYFKIKAADGKVIGAAPLTFQVDDFQFPIAAAITGNSATLTPQIDQAHAVYKPVALPYENQAPWKNDYEREQAAWSRLTSTVSMAATVGTMVGGIGGAAVGCLAGGIFLGALSGTLTLLFGLVPGAVAGCLIGIATIGPLGVLAGQLLVTGPAIVLAGIQYFTTINQPYQNNPAPAPAK